MAFRSRLLALTALASLTATGVPAQAQIFWNPPDFSGPPVRGDEPGLGLPLTDATQAEIDAQLVWNMRAGLNVAALQCQFAPTLLSVRNYNDLLRQHSREFTASYQTLAGYFKRMAGKKPGAVAASQVELDQYTTKTYNGFSTMHAQLGFCHTAARIAYEALGRPKGSLLLTARARMREFRNSLIPKSDRIFLASYIPPQPLPTAPDPCWDYKKDKPRKRCPSAAR